MTGRRNPTAGRRRSTIRTPARLEAREVLRSLAEIDDVSLFGTELHARGRAGAGQELLGLARRALAGTVEPERILLAPPNLEDVFVLRSEEDEAAERSA